MDTTAAIAHYHALLRDDPGMAQASGEQLLISQPGARLMFGPRAMCSCLRPQLLDAETYARVAGVCAVLAGATKRLEATLLATPTLLELLDLSEQERELVAIDPGYGDSAAATRLDSFVAGEHWQFVEYNAESPAGIAYTDTLSELFRELPIMRRFEERYRLRPLPARFALLDALLGAYREWGGQGMPHVAIVDWAGLPTATEFELFREFFATEGIVASIVEPASLEFRDGRLHAPSGPVDLVYRRALTHELLARRDEASALLSAYAAGAVCVVNGFRCKLFHKKAIFAILSDESYAALFSPEEREALRRHIPWTRRLRDGYTEHGGRRVDLVEHALANRERLVLKPNDDYGGRGVVLGWEADQGVWEAELAQALRGSYVVQERVETARASYPVYQDGAVGFVDFTTDLDPFLFGTRVTGMLTRVSAAALLNVTAGSASTIPTYILEGEH